MNVSRETEGKLREYRDLLLKWNKAINLISASTVEDMWQRHINDSLQLMLYIPDCNVTLLDVGAGAGLPGMVLSIAGIEKVILVESDTRKSAFLQQAKKISSKDVIVLNSRIEEAYVNEVDIITARAFSKIRELLIITKNIKASKYLLLKGVSWEQEVVEAQKEWLFDFDVYDSITAYGGKVVKIWNVRQKS